MLRRPTNPRRHRCHPSQLDGYERGLVRCEACGATWELAVGGGWQLIDAGQPPEGT